MSLGEAAEDLGFPVGVAKTAEDIKRLPVVAEGLGCVGHGTLIIPLVFPQLGESAVGVSLAGKITILLGQGEALTEVVQGFFVAIR